MTPAQGPRQTVGRLLTAAAERLQQAGVRHARLEARVLTGHVLGLDTATILGRPEREVPSEAAERLREAIERRAAGEPTAYLAGRREFYGRSFRVDPRVLIPRPETELLVEQALAAVVRSGECPLVVDIGTGSGCVAISIALEAPAAQVVACDVSSEALAVAAANIDELGGRPRVQLVQGDLLSWLGRQPEVVVANLPYVPSEALESLSTEVRDHEPRLALDGGPGGAVVILRLLDQALRLGFGTLLAEVDCRHAAAVLAVAREHWPEAESSILLDLAGRPRVLCVVAA